MALNLQSEQTKILYLPLKDEAMPNLKAHTTLTLSEHGKLHDIKSDTFDVCTGITKQRYRRPFLSQIYRTLKPGGLLMFQIGAEIDVTADLTLCGFSDIESRTTDQIKHWTARRPRSEKSSQRRMEQKPKSKVSRPKMEEIVTSYRTSKRSLGRWFIPIESAVESIGSMDALKGSTMWIATVGVGNVAQIAMDVLLTTLSAKGQIVRIGFINDRNVKSGVGNDALIAAPKRRRNGKGKGDKLSGLGVAAKGTLHCPIEVFWHSECRMVLVQQRCAVRMGGRGEFVEGLMRFVERYQFETVGVMTTEYITKRSEDETKNNIKMGYVGSPRFDADGKVMAPLQWRSLAMSGDGKGDGDEEEKLQQNGDSQRRIGHGISRKLYAQCVSEERSAVMVCRYTEDGDNTAESVEYLDSVCKLMDVLNQCPLKLAGTKWKTPHSLSFANGGRLPNCIY